MPNINGLVCSMWQYIKNQYTKNEAYFTTTGSKFACSQINFLPDTEGPALRF